MTPTSETIGNIPMFHSAPVMPELRSYVRAYAETDLSTKLDPAPTGIAALECILQFDSFPPRMLSGVTSREQTVQRVSVVGPRTQPGAPFLQSGRIRTFRIFFQPCGLWQLFRVPQGGLVNQALPASDMLGVDSQLLGLQMADCASFKARVGTVEQFLLHRAERASARTPIMNAAVSMYTDPDVIRIDELAYHSGLGIRQFERRFALEIGMSPKLFARIARFQAALDAKLSLPTRSWMSIAHESGYHDQMHMIRDFQSLGGDSPERMLPGLGDTRPPALVASDKAALRSSLESAGYVGCPSTNR